MPLNRCLKADGAGKCGRLSVCRRVFKDGALDTGIMLVDFGHSAPSFIISQKFPCILKAKFKMIGAKASHRKAP
jgi:hypothetical protein